MHGCVNKFVLVIFAAQITGFRFVIILAYTNIGVPTLEKLKIAN